MDNQIILKVYLDSTHEKTAEVPITPSTTCCDVIECCREPGEEGCHIAELWRGCERPIDDEEKPYEILQQWGMHRDEVKFYLRHQPALSPTSEEGRRGGEKRKNGMKEEESTNMLPSGVDLTLSDLQEMATRQQQQIEAQQEMLVAKEQRLKFLKQQELRHQQIASENERLRKVREKVEAQELKLKKLRALRGQSNDCKASNAILTTELESIKTLFNEKEKELTTAVGKVEELSRQLEELRNGHLGKINGCTALNSSPAILELEKLRKELMIRNKLNEQQSSKLAAHREVLMQRNDEITRMDQRVAELQLRLRTKRANPAPTQPVPPEQTKTSGDGAASRTSRVLSANVAAVEPYLQRTVAKEPLVSNLEKAYNLSKQDPKYQTLPYGIKFSSLDGKKTESNVTDDKKASVKDSSEKNGRPYGPTPTTTTSGYYRPSVGSTFVLAPKVNQDNVSTSMSQTRPSASIGSSLSPRPFGTPYSVGVPSVKSSTGNSTSPASSPSIVYTKQSSPSAGYQKTSTPVTSAVTNSTSATLREIFIMGGPNGPTSSENVTDSPPAGSQKPRPVTVTPTTIQGSPPRTTAAVNVKSAAYQLAISRPQPSAPAHRSVNLHSPTNSASSSTRPLSPTLRKNFSKPPSGAGVYGTRPVQPSTSGAGIAYEITSKTGTTSSQSAPQWTTNSVNVIPSSSSATSSSQMSPRRTPPVSNTQPFTNQPGRLAAKLKSAFFEEASIASGVPNTSIELRTNGSELRSTDSETNLPETRSNEAKQRYPEARQNGPDMKQSAPIGRQTDARQSGPQMTQSVPEVKQNEAIQRSSEQRQKGPEIKKHVAESRPVPSSIVATRATSSEQRVTVPEQKSKAMETRLGDMDVKSTAVNARQSSGVDTRPTTAVNTRQSSRVDTRPTTAVNTRQSSGVDMRPTTAVNARQSSGVDTRPTTTVSTPGIMRPNAAADPRAVAVSKPGSVDSRPSMTNSRTDSRPNITTINDTKSGIEAIVDQTSKSSETDLRASKPEDTTDSKDPKVDTSPNSVSSALSVLMAAPATTAASKPTYRYAPKSVIANTYMRKLGTDALEQYRKNMSQLYKDFLPGDGMPEAASQEQTTNDGAPPNLMAPPGSPQRIAGSHPPGSPQRLSGSRPPGSPQRLSGSHPPNGMVDRFGDDSPPFAGGIPNHPEHERLRYRPNAPRPLRRRLSNSEHDEYPKQIQRANQRLFSGSRPPVHPSTERNNKVNIASTKATGPPPDIIRVDHLQDSYNSNYSIDNVEQKAEVHYGPELDNNIPFADEGGKAVSPVKETHLPMALRFKKTNLKSKDSARSSRRVSFDPLALMLDASLEGELDLVKRTARQVPDPSLPNDEGITALHNAICAGHFEIVKFLVEYGCNVNAPDSDGWTPLHCAASCNNLPMVKLLVEHGACIFATTISDQETAAEKCEEDEDGYDGCSEYLYSIQEKLGILNNGVVYGVFDYQAHNTDELSFRDGNAICILRKGDEKEKEWWWSRINNKEGYIPRNLIGLHPRVFPQWKRSDLSSGEKT